MSIIDVYHLCNGMDIITFTAEINESKYRKYRLIFVLL